MTITEIFTDDYEGGARVYMVEDNGKTSFICGGGRPNDSRYFCLMTKEGGFLEEVKDDPELQSFVEAVEQGTHKEHPLGLE